MDEEEIDFLVIVVGTWTTAIIMLLAGFAVGWVLKGLWIT